jgi:zinc protease
MNTSVGGASRLGAEVKVLDNGLTVLVREVRTAPLVSVWCWYRVGSKDERPGLTGVSHWCEHMNFKGTTNIPRDKVKGIIDQYGGFWNGYTWIDQTT